MDLSTLGCQRNQKKDSRHITRGMFIPPGKSDLGCISTLKTVWIELPREREKSILNPLLDADSEIHFGRLAQGLERDTDNVEVDGSNPSSPTILVLRDAYILNIAVECKIVTLIYNFQIFELSSNIVS